jgi:release factor glutamine methyltransferase
MMNIQEAVAKAQRELAAVGVESARITAELLLAHVLNWERVRVLAHAPDPIDAITYGRFRELVQRRSEGEPLQYLTGKQEFCGYSFKVTPAVLIPRPETELLVESALRLAKNVGRERLAFLDVGTGSGCIAISLALGYPQARGCAIDVSSEALAIARENAARHGVLDRIWYICGDFLECIARRPQFDFILSNPPYVAEADALSLPATVRDHEPRIALFGGESGMHAFLRIIPAAAECLLPGGYLLLEIGAGMSRMVADHVQKHPFAVVSILEDLQSIPRCLVARRNHG